MCRAKNCNYPPVDDMGLCYMHTKRTKKEKNIDEMRKFFLEIWKKRRHHSEISGEFLGWDPLTVFFHHILPKEKYPEAAFDKENIILLTLNEHGNVENNMYIYEEVNNRREKLIKKYERSN